MTGFKRFFQNQTASAAVEYGLIGALILTAIMAGVLQLSAATGGKFDFVAAAISAVIE